MAPWGYCCKATGTVEMLRVLKPSVFWPQPQVDSALLRYVRDPDKVSTIRNMSCLMEVIDLFIGHRRKMLKACVKQARGDLTRVSSWQAVFEQCNLDPTLRPEQITPEGICEVGERGLFSDCLGHSFNPFLACMLATRGYTQFQVS